MAQNTSLELTKVSYDKGVLVEGFTNDVTPLDAHNLNQLVGAILRNKESIENLNTEYITETELQNIISTESSNRNRIDKYISGLTNVPTSGSYENSNENLRLKIDELNNTLNLLAVENIITTYPSISVNIGNPEYTGNGYVEVGSTIAPNYSITFNAGEYKYEPKSTGCKSTGYNVTFNNVTKHTYSGTFNQITVKDDTNLSMNIECYHSEGVTPKNKLGLDYPTGKIEAGTLKSTKYFKGYRKTFYGTLDNKPSTMNSSTIRGLTKSTESPIKKKDVFNIDVVVGAKRVIFAYPKSVGDVTSVIDVNGMNANITNSFTKTEIDVYDATENSGAMTYNVYYLDFAASNDTLNTFKVTI